jgi:Fe-S-cluster containining protein
MSNQAKKTAEALAHGHPCHSCGAACCRYIAAALAPPRDVGDRDLIHWYLSHTAVCIYIDKDGDWWIQVATDCRHIVADGRCAIYETRPQLCRRYGTDTCERADHDDENIAEFATVQQFETFFEENFRIVGDKVRRRHRRYRPAAP